MTLFSKILLRDYSPRFFHEIIVRDSYPRSFSEILLRDSSLFSSTVQPPRRAALEEPALCLRSVRPRSPRSIAIRKQFSGRLSTTCPLDESLLRRPPPYHVWRTQNRAGGKTHCEIHRRAWSTSECELSHSNMLELEHTPPILRGPKHSVSSQRQRLQLRLPPGRDQAQHLRDKKCPGSISAPSRRPSDTGRRQRQVHRLSAADPLRKTAILNRHPSWSIGSDNRRLAEASNALVEGATPNSKRHTYVSDCGPYLYTAVLRHCR